MKIYVDLVLFLNFAFDFLLLLVVSILLRRNVSVHKLMLGAFIGSFTILCLFFRMSSFSLFLIKVLISVVMIMVSFGFRNIKYFCKNMGILYMSSMVLGGFLYFLNVQFSYSQVGLVFYHHGLGINFILLVLFSPLILYIYIKQGKAMKQNYNFYYKVNIFFQNQKIRLNAFLDTGNKLIDPITRTPIILIHNRRIVTKNMPFIYVPYHAVGQNGVLKCIRIPYMEIEGIGKRENVLVGLMNEKIRIDGVDCILNSKLLEG